MILGVETSCDDTALALYDPVAGKLRASKVHTQPSNQQRFGGVVPEVAAREHMRALHAVYKSLLSEAALAADQIQAVAVTAGPGLVGALLVGTAFARGLATGLQVPLWPVDHIEAHIVSAWLRPVGEPEPQAQFPALALVVSGGHTHLYHMETFAQRHLLGSTRDDAVGECFDKVAKLLGLSWPGGPAIEQLASKAQCPGRFPMPRLGGLGREGLDLSFSGLKTHIANTLTRLPSPHTLEDFADLAAGFQQAAIEALLRVLERAVAQHQGVKTLVVAGGVAANALLRTELYKRFAHLNLTIPPLEFCGDNAAMVAKAACCLPKTGDFPSWKPWDCYSRQPLFLPQDVPT